VPEVPREQMVLWSQKLDDAVPVDQNIEALEKPWAENESREASLFGSEVPWAPKVGGSPKERRARLQAQRQRLQGALGSIERRRDGNVSGPAPKPIASVTDPDQPGDAGQGRQAQTEPQRPDGRGRGVWNGDGAGRQRPCGRQRAVDAAAGASEGEQRLASRRGERGQPVQHGAGTGGVGEAGRQGFSAGPRCAERGGPARERGLGIRRFVHRGLGKVRTEWLLICTVVNMGILLRHWSEVQEVV
jgi:hypothetical protein